MSKRTFLLTAVALLLVVFVIKTGPTISEAASTEDPPVPNSEPQSIHQKASTCWEDFDVPFNDEPQDCQSVCDTCHTFATVIGGQANPEAYTTDMIFPVDLGEENVNWNTIGLLQKSCRSCHTDITEAEPGSNHVVFVEYDTSGSGQNFKETRLKLFDQHILCTTCHSPHRDEVALLRLSNHGSTLCLDCHST